MEKNEFIFTYMSIFDFQISNFRYLKFESRNLRIEI